MKKIRKAVDLKKKTKKVDCANYGTCCYAWSGFCCK